MRREGRCSAQLDQYASYATHVAWDASNVTKNAFGGNFCMVERCIRQMKDSHTCPKFLNPHHKMCV